MKLKKQKTKSKKERVQNKWGDTRKHFYFIYVFLVALGPLCYVRAFSSCGEQGLLFVEVCRLLTVVASLAVEHGL